MVQIMEEIALETMAADSDDSDDAAIAHLNMGQNSDCDVPVQTTAAEVLEQGDSRVWSGIQESQQHRQGNGQSPVRPQPDEMQEETGPCATAGCTYQREKGKGKRFCCLRCKREGPRVHSKQCRRVECDWASDDSQPETQQQWQSHMPEEVANHVSGLVSDLVSDLLSDQES